MSFTITSSVQGGFGTSQTSTWTPPTTWPQTPRRFVIPPKEFLPPIPACMETSCATHLSASLSPPSLTWHRSHSQRTSSFGLGWYSDEGERVFILALKAFAVLPSCKLWVNTDSFFSDLWFTDYRNHRSVFGLVSHPHPTVQQQSCTSVWKYVICTLWAKRLRMFVRRNFLLLY